MTSGYVHLTSPRHASIRARPGRATPDPAWRPCGTGRVPGAAALRQRRRPAPESRRPAPAGPALAT